MFNKTTMFNRNDPPQPRRDNGTASSGAGAASSRSPVAGEAAPGGRVPTIAASTAASPREVPAITSNPAGTGRVAASEATSLPVAADAEASEIGDAHLLVGPGVKLKGAEILDCDTLVVEGRVEATMDSRILRIAESGSFVGKVSIDVAEIHGSFEGDLTARTQLIIHATGRVKGTIRYGRLVAYENCELCGDVSMLGSTSSASGRDREVNGKDGKDGQEARDGKLRERDRVAAAASAAPVPLAVTTG